MSSLPRLCGVPEVPQRLLDKACGDSAVGGRIKEKTLVWTEPRGGWEQSSSC